MSKAGPVSLVAYLHHDQPYGAWAGLLFTWENLSAISQGTPKPRRRLGNSSPETAQKFLLSTDQDDNFLDFDIRG